MSTLLQFQNPTVLEGEKIKLVPMELVHASELFAINDHDIWAFMLGEIKTLQEMENWVANAIQFREQNLALPFVVMLKETNQIVGTTRLYEINEKQRSCELGSTWYSKEFQRSFVNSNCKYILLKYCFEELQFIRVQFKTDERNKRSQKAIERLGAVKEGIMRNERILSNGFIRNSVLYSITNDDWSSVKQGFKERDAYYSKK
jgi:RimJ/RimL family protein N-acetyltransferase